MTKQLLDIIPDVSSHHVGILFLLGMALFGGTIGGGIFQKLRIPKVVGYIMVGVLIGQTGFKIVSKEVIETLQPFSSFALGLIGFMIGGELKKSVVMRHGKQFLIILFAEGLVTFFVVTGIVVVVAGFFIEDPHFVWALALLLGAIASATAPAATTDVLWEYKTRGPLTSIILGIVALDDGLALLLFAFASSVAGSLTGSGSGGSLAVFFAPVYEVGGAILLGLIVGAVFCFSIKRTNDEDSILAFSVGAVILLLGIAKLLEVDSLIAAMTLGVIASNYRPNKSKEIFSLVQSFTPPIYVLFFVLFGSKLDLNHLTAMTLALSVTYLIARTGGKFLGAGWGARLSKAPMAVQKYLPLCLFSQAGVAIGLSIIAGSRFSGGIGDSILVIITTTTFIVQIFGPICTKIAVHKADEVGKNVTEEQLISNLRVDEFMNRSIPLLHEDTSAKEVLRIFSLDDCVHFPVVDDDKTLVGVVTLDNIKGMFCCDDPEDALSAGAIMSEVPASVTPDTSLEKVREKLASKQLEFMLIADENNKFLGMLESRKIEAMVAAKIIEVQKTRA